MQTVQPYHPKHKVRIVTAASLFDGHDAAINIMRRIMQASGAEVIHLGHNRSVYEIVNTAVQEDVQGIAITSYQGGHNEFFKYMYDLLRERGAGHIKIFGGGGGTILPTEIEDLHQYGINRIYSPDDGRELGLQGMINDVLQQCDFPVGENLNGEVKKFTEKDATSIARMISCAENDTEHFEKAVRPQLKAIFDKNPELKDTPVLGITGTGGAGKSSLVDEILRRFLIDFDKRTIAIISVDPSKRKSGGALLGDRIRMNAVNNDRVFMRSLATRQSNLALSKHVQSAVEILKAAGYDLVVLETSGIGQSDTEIVDHSDVSLYVMTPEFGAASQLEKIDMIDFADIIAINKFDKRGAQDALRDVRKQYQRAHLLWSQQVDDMPVHGTIASQFNDHGTNVLYTKLISLIAEKGKVDWKSSFHAPEEMSEKIYIIPPKRVRYLSEISENNRRYDEWAIKQEGIARKLFSLNETIRHLGGENSPPLPPLGEGGSLESRIFPSVTDDSSSGTQSSPPSQGGAGGVNPETHTGRLSGGISNHPNLKTFRRELRNNMTPAEAKLWSMIQGRNLGGRKFRRQHSVGPYILDFYCPEENLAVELDGAGHFTSWGAERDVERDQFLNAYGILVVRIENKWVFEQPVNALAFIESEFGWKKKLAPPAPPLEGGGLVRELREKFQQLKKELDPHLWDLLQDWENKKANYAADEYVYYVRGKEIKVPTKTKSLSGTKIPRVLLPKYKDWGEIIKWCLQENVPGEFPYTAGVFPFKRKGEDPTRMFAGEGGPERTNRRFHYLSSGMPASRLSTAFDSVTLYGENPDHRPDIFGKIGNSGVSVCCLDDAKKLYSGFDLCNPKTSVSMTINGPAATICAFFMNAAIDQQCELYIREHKMEHLVESKLKELYDDKGLERPAYSPSPTLPKGEGVLPEGHDGLGLLLLGVTGDQILPADVYNELKARALSSVRGTVQADILKEDQAQNTCIFSTEFSLKLMGDVQEYFIEKKVRNFYSVSISGYHIAEAGANPITQLAFTLANGFTFVEYYLSRGMNIDDFAPNLSFFFSNGVDPEYAVIGRVARRIWAKAMKEKYGANERSQMLKYHIQTSGRSLHAQEIDFNDIRTTLQALYAIYDNCNSLHTNAYDEAITTPTEESVRRAVAIQMIINHELGLAKNENPLQGAFIIEELTELVEAAVLSEFDRITERGGVLGAMETMYQRGKIQEESLYYEHQKHTGEFPIIGVNTFLSKNGSPTIIPQEVIRSTEEEKLAQIATRNNLHQSSGEKSGAALKQLQTTSLHNWNIFAELMETVKTCSLGQITNALFEVGGQYRRNM